ncbi:MAG: NAD(P)/FAD-dependent oxidoreductase [Acidimicrobiales bacterium]
MGSAVVVGAGVAGLAAALRLAGDGLDVTVVERDDPSLPPTPDDAFDHWPRRGAPQVHHSHAFLALLRNLLRDRHPELLSELLAVGATELRFTENLPEDMSDRDPRPGDDDLVALACRRTTFEWVLRKHALAVGRIGFEQASVSGLTIGGAVSAGAPHIAGVVLSGGGSIDADWVIDASGRRSALPKWASEVGATVGEREEDTGIVYSSRFYRLRPGQEPPEMARPAAADLGYLKFAVFLGDNRTYSITFGLPSGDADLRALLRDPGFTLAAAAIPALRPWAATELAEPITDVQVMAKLLNRRRTFVDDRGPVLTGLLAVGDAHTCTNQMYGRGCSLGFLAAHLAADAIATEDDPVGVALAYDSAMRAQVHPWYVSAVAQDRRSRATLGTDDTGVRDDEVTDASMGMSAENIESLLRDGLLPATRTDPVVFRAFLRAFNLLDPPEQLLQDAEVMGRVLAVWQDRANRPPAEQLGPGRDALLASLAG